MKIKKLGHCCFVVEVNNIKIITDPGSWTVQEHKNEKNINIVLITHEHSDHIHIDSLKDILSNNPSAQIITNNGVGKLLSKAGIQYLVLENKELKEFSSVKIEAYNCKHEEIYKEKGQVENTAFFIEDRLFYPGDAFYNPGKEVGILALPVAGPWANVKDSINYALSIHPKVCFPVHDGMLKSFGANHNMVGSVLKENNINFISFEDNKEEEF